jgi:hypothetical protein
MSTESPGQRFVIVIHNSNLRPQAASDHLITYLNLCISWPQVLTVGRVNAAPKRAGHSIAGSFNDSPRPVQAQSVNRVAGRIKQHLLRCQLKGSTVPRKSSLTNSVGIGEQKGISKMSFRMRTVGKIGWSRQDIDNSTIRQSGEELKTVESTINGNTS